MNGGQREELLPRSNIVQLAKPSRKSLNEDQGGLGLRHEAQMGCGDQGNVLACKTVVCSLRPVIADQATPWEGLEAQVLWLW